jgi:hypothetical protein
MSEHILNASFYHLGGVSCFGFLPSVGHVFNSMLMASPHHPLSSVYNGQRPIPADLSTSN